MENFSHISVLLQETIEGLAIKPNGIYVDCTLGGGGHSEEILKRLTTGFLYAFDQDEHAIEAATKRLAPYQTKFEIIHRNFRYLKEELIERGVHSVDGILFDLGVSSPQFDVPERGFSYHYDAPLDMRMDQTQSLSAYDVVNRYSYEQLLSLLYKYGEEPFAKQIAREIERNRPVETTLQLVELIKNAIPAKFRREKHPAKRTFQAIRIEVNKELEVLPQALLQAIELINVKGRICVITFHSLEDKLTKDLFKKFSEKPFVPRGLPIIDDEVTLIEFVNRKVIIANEIELVANHRSHSAKLRIVEKKREMNREKDTYTL